MIDRPFIVVENKEHRCFYVTGIGMAEDQMPYATFPWRDFQTALTEADRLLARAYAERFCALKNFCHMIGEAEVEKMLDWSSERPHILFPKIKNGDN